MGAVFIAPEFERSVIWNDPDIGIRWPFDGEPILAPKDRAGARLARAEVYP